jgi:GH35 family endo-1,4-beta-xylanase
MLVVLAAVAAAAAEPSQAYRDQWKDPALVRTIDENIEAHRKADGVVTVTAAGGRPVAGARVRAVQTSHEFLFGANAFMVGGFDTPEKNAAYEAAFARLCNFATVPFYWSDLEPREGHVRFTKDSEPIFRRPPPDLVVEFGRRHGLTLKGHPLIWHSWYPTWLPKDEAKVAELASKRFAQIAERYAASIRVWDVVNEALAFKGGRVMPMGKDYLAWSFGEAARRFRPDNHLMINETTGNAHGGQGKNAPYYRQIRGLLDRGLRVDGIGFQFHLFGTGTYERLLEAKLYPPKQLLDTYTLYGDFDKPLWVTEITIPQHPGPEGEAEQAEVVANLYRLWFSAPRMAGITWWNLADGTAVKGEDSYRGGLLNEALQPKPAYQALDRLINQAWKTQAEGRTDGQGRFAFRGFCGRYAVTVESPDGKAEVEMTVTKTGPSAAAVTLPR